MRKHVGKAHKERLHIEYYYSTVAFTRRFKDEWICFSYNTMIIFWSWVFVKHFFTFEGLWNNDHIRHLLFFTPLFMSFLLRYYLHILERGKGSTKKGERNINVCLPLAHPLSQTWPATQACALDWELNQWPFGSKVGTQFTEPHHPGFTPLFLLYEL